MYSLYFVSVVLCFIVGYLWSKVNKQQNLSNRFTTSFTNSVTDKLRNQIGQRNIEIQASLNKARKDIDLLAEWMGVEFKHIDVKGRFVVPLKAEKPVRKLKVKHVRN